MKRYWLLAALMLLCTPAFAWTTQKSTVIDAVTLDADPTSVNSDSVYAGGLEALSFDVIYDETEVGGIQVAITLQASYDNSVWIAASFYDYAGGATLQTSETLTADSTGYILWVNKDLCVPYYRVVVTATGSDADDTAVITAYASMRG